jgi:hypothetical protein
MPQELKDLASEVERLISLTEEVRESEGVYASVSQLQFLLKKINSSKSTPSALNGIEKFISDLASSDSEVLRLLDQLRAVKNG